jgi:hypothetical protein
MTTENNDFFISEFPVHIQNRIDAGIGCGSSCGKGWLQIIIDADKKLNKINPDYAIDQIKEKFGLLRIYISGIGYDNAGEILEEAEERSGKICELCGKDAELKSTNSWYQTCCDEHRR